MKVIKALGALLVLALLVVGVPLGLSAVGGSPIPETIPSSNQVISSLMNPDAGALLFLILKYVGWFAWLTFAASVLIAIPSAARGVKAPRLPGLGWQQKLAAVLLGAIAFGLVPQAVMAAPVQQGPVNTGIAQQLFTPLDAQGSGATSVQTGRTVAEIGPQTITVQPGESLWSIAERHLGDGERWPEIAQLNYGVTQRDGSALGASHVLEVGWQLQIPGGGVQRVSTESTESSVSTESVIHTVEKGDTLWDISEQYLGDGARYPELVEATGDTVQPDGRQLQDPDLIYPGWEITVPGVETDAAETTDVATAQPDGVTSNAARENVKEAPAAGVDAANTATDVEDAEDAEEALSATTIGGAGGVLAAGVIGVLAYRRRETQRRRTPGMRLALPVPGSSAAGLERQLRAIADPMSLEMVDRVMRSLAEFHQSHSLPLPDIRAARMSGEYFEIYLGSPSALPDPWTETEAGLVWSITAAAAGALHPSYGSRAPYPTLVTVGVDESGAHIMLDMEHVVSLDVRGAFEVAHSSIAALAAELATTPWADDLRVTLVGTVPELGNVLNTGRIRHVPSLEHVIRELEERADAIVSALDGAGTESIPAAQGAGMIEPEWTPEVVLVGSPIPTELRSRLQSLLAKVPRVGIAAITSGVDGEWALVIDPASPQYAVLEPAGLPVRIQQLTPQEYADVISILSGTSTLVPGPSWAANLVAEEPAISELRDVERAELSGPDADPVESALSGTVPEPTFPELVPNPALVAGVSATSAPSVASAPAPSAASAAEGAPLAPQSGFGAVSASSGPDAEITQLRYPRVHVLGTVELEAPAGTELAEKDRSQALELIAYLALNPGATNEQLSAALWPGREAKNATRNSAVSRARRWLGADNSGMPHLPIATTSETFGTYSLTGVSSDWQEFLAIVGPDAASAPTAALRQALDLVRGKPFDGARVGKYTWAEPHVQEMISSIVDVAHEVARRSLMGGDVRGAKWAAAVGLAVTNDDERLWRDAMKAEWLGGDQRTLWDLVRRCYDHFQDLDVTPDAETEALVDEMRTAAAAIN